MWLLFASVAGFFPAATVPIGLGWKELSAFDVLFGGAVVHAAWTRRFTPINRRLVIAAFSLSAAGLLSLLLHWSPWGWKSVLRTAYSLTVLVLTAHMCVDPPEARRAIRVPMLIALSVAWIIFIAENTLQTRIGSNQSGALPNWLFRLGGLTGGSVLAIFLSAAVPFVGRSGVASLAMLASSWATLSRSMLGVGVATLLSKGSWTGANAWRRATTVLACVSIAASLFGYFFAVIPANPDDRTSLAPSFRAGAYLTLNRTAFRVWMENPAFGKGPGQFEHTFAEVASGEEQWLVGGQRYGSAWAPHSAILGLLAEEGLLGLMIFIWLFGEVYRRVATGDEPEHRTAGLASVTGVLCAGLFLDWIALKGLWLWIGLIVAASTPTPREQCSLELEVGAASHQ